MPSSPILLGYLLECPKCPTGQLSMPPRCCVLPYVPLCHFPLPRPRSLVGALPFPQALPSGASFAGAGGTPPSTGLVEDAGQDVVDLQCPHPGPRPLPGSWSPEQLLRIHLPPIKLLNPSLTLLLWSTLPGCYWGSPHYPGQSSEKELRTHPKVQLACTARYEAGDLARVGPCVYWPD
jgi:hypothetical protein